MNLVKVVSQPWFHAFLYSFVYLVFDAVDHIAVFCTWMCVEHSHYLYSVSTCRIFLGSQEGELLEFNYGPVSGWELPDSDPFSSSGAAGPCSLINHSTSTLRMLLPAVITASFSTMGGWCCVHWRIQIAFQLYYMDDLMLTEHINWFLFHLHRTGVPACVWSNSPCALRAHRAIIPVGVLISVDGHRNQRCSCGQQCLQPLCQLAQLRVGPYGLFCCAVGWQRPV